MQSYLLLGFPLAVATLLHCTPSGPGTTTTAVPGSAARASTNPPPPKVPSVSKITLRVSLFPWVPDPESLFRWIESDFEHQNEDIDLIVRPRMRALEKTDDGKPNPEFIGDLAYEPNKAVASLLGTNPPDTQDVVEVDSVTLSNIKDAIQPFAIEKREFFRFAQRAATLGEETYGIPHWACGYFVVSEYEAIRNADDLRSLLGVLSKPNTSRVDVVGDLDGSWDAIAVYLDSVRDTDPARDLVAELQKPKLDASAAASLTMLGKACLKDGKSYCGDDGTELFANGEADAMIGYSERLNAILSRKERAVGELHVASAALGSGKHPTLFTDILVLSRNCTGPCKEAATRFASYYVHDKTFEHVLMNEDGKTGPRYLLPSTESAFAFGKVATERLYAELREEIRDAKPFPNSGIPEARNAGTIRGQVKHYLGTARQ